MVYVIVLELESFLRTLPDHHLPKDVPPFWNQLIYTIEFDGYKYRRYLDMLACTNNFYQVFFCCLLYFLTVRGPLCKKEKESERLFIIFRKCSIAAVVAKRIEMASGLFRAYFGLVMGSIRTLSELAPGTFRAHSVLDSNRIEMASDCDISGLVQTWCWAGSRLENIIEMALGSFGANSYPAPISIRDCSLLVPDSFQ